MNGLTSKIILFFKPQLGAIVFFVIVAILALWQMLLPGYILTLDMIFAQNIKVLVNPASFLNTLPLWYLLISLNFFLPGWAIQKIILLIIFFLPGYLAYRFIPLPKKYNIPLWAGFFYTINPFVYERFLAGQWLILLAYALMPVFVNYVIVFFGQNTLKSSIKLVLISVLISVFSLHFLAIAAIIFIFVWLYHLLKNIGLKNKTAIIKLLKYSSLMLLAWFIISSYWLIPYILSQNQVTAANFNQADYLAFKTASDSRVGTVINVLGLYGYWGENQPWSKYFLWPKENLVLWLFLLAIFGTLIILGIYQSFKYQKRGLSWLFLLIGIFSLIFACGLGSNIFRSLNQWLFEFLWFWRGFRDSQKWSGLLVLIYCYFIGLGIYWLAEKISHLKIKSSKYLLAIFFLLPAVYTYTIWGGFARQLKPVWYPVGWQKVNVLLNQDSDNFKVLFLPWHQYLSLSFNQNLITLNPAKLYFDKPIIQGENIELNDIYSHGQNSQIEDILLKSQYSDQQSVIDGLARQGIKYIIYSHEIDKVEPSMSFKPRQADNLVIRFEDDSLTLFEIMVR